MKRGRFNTVTEAGRLAALAEVGDALAVSRTVTEAAERLGITRVYLSVVKKRLGIEKKWPTRRPKAQVRLPPLAELERVISRVAAERGIR